MVGLADGVNGEYTVIGPRTYPKSDFPSRDIYASHPYGELQLVTCAGLFDATSGHYFSNVVLYSVLTGWSCVRTQLQREIRRPAVSASSGRSRRTG